MFSVVLELISPVFSVVLELISPVFSVVWQIKSIYQFISSTLPDINQARASCTVQLQTMSGKPGRYTYAKWMIPFFVYVIKDLRIKSKLNYQWCKKKNTERMIIPPVTAFSTFFADLPQIPRLYSAKRIIFLETWRRKHSHFRERFCSFEIL